MEAIIITNYYTRRVLISQHSKYIYRICDFNIRLLQGVYYFIIIIYYY